MVFSIFIVIILFLIVPVFLYRCNCRLMAWFCYVMSQSPSFRKFYCFCLLIAVLATHVIYYNTFSKEMTIAISTIILFAMFRTLWVRSFLSVNRRRKRLFYVFFVLTMMVTILIRLLPLAITMGILVVGMSFYPSKQILEIPRKEFIKVFFNNEKTGDYRKLIDLYFS